MSLNDKFDAAKGKWKAEKEAFENRLVSGARRSRVELWIEGHPILALIIAIVVVLGVLFTVLLI